MNTAVVTKAELAASVIAKMGKHDTRGIKVHLDSALVQELDHLSDDSLLATRAQGNNVSGVL